MPRLNAFVALLHAWAALALFVQPLAAQENKGVAPPSAAAMDELRRKADAREDDNGFCAKTGWDAAPDDEKRWLDARKIGSFLASKRGERCTVERIQSVGTTFNEAPCVVTRMWICSGRGDSRRDSSLVGKCAGTPDYVHFLPKGSREWVRSIPFDSPCR